MSEEERERRFVVLTFDDGDRFDYEPPLPHPADVFLERFAQDGYLNADVGASTAFEVLTSPEPDSSVTYPPSEPPSRGWFDKF